MTKYIIGNAISSLASTVVSQHKLAVMESHISKCGCVINILLTQISFDNCSSTTRISSLLSGAPLDRMHRLTVPLILDWYQVRKIS